MQNSLLQSMNGNSPTNLINLPALWNHESFWCSELGQTQTVVDWDVFVKHFSEQVKKWANYELNSTQKDFIRTKIDPEHRCEVYKSGFLLFVRDFWEVPSNRTNLFKMKINFSSLFSKLTLLESRPMCHLKITVKYLDEEGKIRLRNYDYNNDNIKDLEMQSFYKVREKGFITIGSHAENDICISDSIHINNFHVKFIAVHKQYVVERKPYELEESTEHTIKTEWYLRDISRSNRLKYVLDQPYKYVSVYPGMLISIGLVEDYVIRIDRIGSATSQINHSEDQYKQVLDLLNADRIDQRGDVDPSIPIKTFLRLETTETTQQEVEDMFLNGDYYPRKHKSFKSQTKDQLNLEFSVVNTRDNTQQKHLASRNEFTVGRSSSCTFVIDQPIIRHTQCQFRMINGVWTLSLGHKQSYSEKRSAYDLQINKLGVYLATAQQAQHRKCSGRVQFTSGYPYILRTKQFQISTQLIQ